MNTALERAVAVYRARRDRMAHPAGHADNGGRWYPAEGEKCACCAHIRPPSRAFPWSYMVHCRTMPHIAALCGVDVRELRRAVRAAQG